MKLVPLWEGPHLAGKVYQLQGAGFSLQDGQVLKGCTKVPREQTEPVLSLGTSVPESCHPATLCAGQSADVDPRCSRARWGEGRPPPREAEPGADHGYGRLLHLSSAEPSQSRFETAWSQLRTERDLPSPVLNRADVVSATNSTRPSASWGPAHTAPPPQFSETEGGQATCA